MILVVCIPAVQATSWVALWQLVDQADVIVAGKVARIEPAKPAAGPMSMPWWTWAR